MGTELDSGQLAAERSRIKTIALGYAERGLSVIPLTHPWVDGGKSKSATVDWRRYTKSRATVEQVSEWFGTEAPLHNIGIVTGAISSLTVLNLSGQADREVAARNDALPFPDLYVRTENGEHRYYGWDARYSIETGVRLDGIEVIAENGYIIGVGSRLPDGRILVEQSEAGQRTGDNLTPLPESIVRTLSGGHGPAAEPRTNDAELPSPNDLRAAAGAKILLSNVDYIEGPMGSETGIARPLGLIRKEVIDNLNGWPCTAAGTMFAVKAEPTGVMKLKDGLVDTTAIWWIKNENDLFAWFHSVCDGVLWQTGQVRASVSDPTFRSLASKAEFFRLLSEYPATAYTGIETLPHLPELPNTRYLLPPIPKVDPSLPYWKEWIALFNPETEADRILIQAMCLTLLWGGAAGTRPAFLITSTHGRGVGKSATGEAVAAITGGSINPSQLADGPRGLPNALISPEGLLKRVVLWDNLKGKQDYAIVESMITAQSLQGHRLYVGHSARPNYITWILTANRAEASTDLAQRCVPIEIGKAKHDVDFINKYTTFLREHRMDLIAEMLYILGPETPRVWELEESKADRWQAWTRAVLCKIPGGDATLPLIAARRGNIDVDAEEGEMLIECVLDLIYRDNKVSPSLASGRFTFASMDLQELALKQGITNLGPAGFGRWISRKVMDGDLKYLTPTRVRSNTGSHVRGYTFNPGPDKMKELILGKSLAEKNKQLIQPIDG